jgi:hypothetical protein
MPFFIFRKDKNMDKNTQASNDQNKTVTIIIEREFVGDKSMSEVFMPIIYDEIINQIKNRTFDKVD